MAEKINAKDVVAKQFFLVPPSEILVNSQDRGRHFPPEPEKVQEMVDSLSTVGQIQPVVCRKNEKNQLVLVAGFTRHEAALIVSEKEKDFKLSVTIAGLNAEDAFMGNVIENAIRNETSAIDDAYNQKRLRDSNGLSDADISRLYNIAPATVLQYKRLLELPAAIQKSVHYGKLAVSAAVELLSMPEADRAAVVADAEKDNGKIDGAKVKARVREYQIIQAESAPAKAPAPVEPEVPGEKKKRKKKTKAEPESKFTPRSMKELKTWIDTARAAEKIPEKKKDFLDMLKRWLAGQRGDAKLQEALDNL